MDQLSEWIQADPYHKDCLNPLWWLTGNGLLSYCLQDDEGPVFFVRTEADKGNLRIHTQFGPEAEVSKMRVAKGILWAIPTMVTFAKQKGLTGLVYQSTSSSLIQFMQMKFGFVPAGNDDYVRAFEDEE